MRACFSRLFLMLVFAFGSALVWAVPAQASVSPACIHPKQLDRRYSRDAIWKGLLGRHIGR
jgi:hypothetical protein